MLLMSLFILDSRVCSCLKISVNTSPHHVILSYLAIVSILASRSSWPPPGPGLASDLGLEAAGASLASAPTEPDPERGMSSSEELKFREHQDHAPQ